MECPLDIVAPDIEQYCIEKTTAVPDLYERLREETYRETDIPQMQVGPLEGRLLMLLTKLARAELAVEIGTFTGYSSLNIAEGLVEGGKLIACDKSDEWTRIARKYWAEAPWGDRIELRLGDAVETVKAIEGPIDFVFIDADKVNYIRYWEALLPKVRSGGLIVADNVLWSGSVLDPERESDHALVAFSEHVAADDRVEQVMLTVRDGVTVARKL
jgi:caffeoyl-CoA O-methyltransferase